MAIDYVHDTQFVYRKILDSMARPGQIASLKKLDNQLEYRLDMYDATILTMLTLFDSEVTFHVLAGDAEDISERITAYTLARPASMAKADFVLVLAGADESAIIDAFTASKKGTLLDPHASATWLIETAFTHASGAGLRITGPGIKMEKYLGTNFSSSIWHARNNAVQEYPLGVDLILTDERMQIVCLPRTTKTDVAEVE